MKELFVNLEQAVNHSFGIPFFFPQIITLSGNLTGFLPVGEGLIQHFGQLAALFGRKEETASPVFNQFWRAAHMAGHHQFAGEMPFHDGIGIVLLKAGQEDDVAGRK